MFDTLRRIERRLIAALLIMMGLVVVLSTIELGIILIKELLTPPRFLLDINKLLEIFGYFLMILIGIELMHSIELYITQAKTHVEVVLTVAIIAIARKVIILDLKATEGLTLLGLAAVILSLGTGYFLVRRAHDRNSPPPAAG
jgi:uncharacterized membrane protein (DUF373 family)